MKYLKFYALLFTLLFFFSCGKDDFDQITIEPLPNEPTIITAQNGLSFRLSNSDETVFTDGIAYTQGNGNYHVGSFDVDVECTSPGGFSVAFDGGTFFSFLFFDDGINDPLVLFGNFETIIDGELIGVTNSLLPFDCEQGEQITVDYVETEDRLSGTFSGEFFALADSLVSPFDSCVNYVSLGILEASFDVELVECE